MTTEPMATGPREEPVFDHERALAMLAGDADLLAEVVHAFLEHIPPQIDELDAAVRISDCTEVERLAHGIKGAAINVHAMRVRQRAAELEASSRANEAHTLPELLHALHDEMNRFQTHLANFAWHELR